MKILIAHNSSREISKLKCILNRSGFQEINVVPNGFEALKSMVFYKYVICVLDEDLKGLNAIDLMNAMHLKGIKSKLIILSKNEKPKLKSSNSILGIVNFTKKNSSDEVVFLINGELPAHGII